MARPKGIIQKRNESKYWLPEGITLLPGQTQNYTKETKLFFNDPEFGEFISCFKALQYAKSSTHPKAVQKRREATNIVLYGGSNPHCNKDVVLKAKRTMVEKYGVEHALQSPQFLSKARDTLETNYGVRNPMHNPEIIEKVLNSTDHCQFTSKGEESVRLFIENELKLKTKTGYIGGNNPKQLDIVIENTNYAIEFNGSYWHSEANKRIYKNYHLDKYKACQVKGLHLLQIFDFEWENRKQQVQSFIRSALGCNEVKLNGRDLTVSIVDYHTAKVFLNDWHILGGKLNFIKAYGLFDEHHGLVSLITIGKHHRNNTEVVLSRYCGKGNITVRGGLSKLTKAALNDFNEISTWIDLRFSNGSNWVKNGWEQVNQLPPDYFYYNTKNSSIISKQSRRKSAVNTPAGLTEHQHARFDNLARIYDCGKIKLVIKKSNKM